MKVISHRSLLPMLAAAVLAVSSCSDGSRIDSGSSPFVTDVQHSAVKRQSIGNCWLYAKASWVESLHLAATSEEANMSESYWTWWHFYDQMVGSGIREISTGGNYYTSAGIILEHGLVLEGEFLPGEADQQMSAAQARAESFVNEALASGGTLSRRQSRTPENVRKVLDEAFGSNMAAAEAVSRPAAEFIVGKTEQGTEVSLAQALSGNNQWNEVSFPRISGKDSVPGPAIERSRRALLRRVMKALNDRKPVIMSVMIDFNALDTEDATFKKSKVDEAGVGHQGGHMVVLEDYVVTNVAGFDGPLPEGDLPEEVKTAALDGELVLLKAKNSWGTDRPGRGLTDGYTRFDNDYLTKQLAWKWSEDSDASQVSYYTTLNDFVLPPGY